jgi:hypothetical protein
MGQQFGKNNPKNLKSMLEAGLITQEEYDQKMEEIKEKMKKKGERKTGLFDKIKEMID